MRSGAASKMSMPQSAHSLHNPNPKQYHLNTYPNSVVHSNNQLGGSMAASQSFGQYHLPGDAATSQKSSSGPKVITYEWMQHYPFWA